MSRRISSPQNSSSWSQAPCGAIASGSHDTIKKRRLLFWDEADLIALHQATPLNTFASAQAFPFSMATNRSGMRAKTGCLLTAEIVSLVEELEQRICEIKHSQLKQMYLQMDQSEMDFFNHTFVAGHDVCTCLHAAFAGQLKDINSFHGQPYNFLFRETNPPTGLPTAKDVKPDNIRRQRTRLANMVFHRTHVVFGTLDVGFGTW